MTYEEFKAAQRRAKFRKIASIVCGVILAVGVVMSAVANYMLSSGQGYQSMGSFAVDSSGLLYVGFDSDILVYSDGQLLYEYTAFPGLEAVAQEDILFTITEEDELILSTGGQDYTLDLQGNVLHSESSAGGAIGPEYSYIAANGDVYTRENILGRSTIVKNGTDTVFRMPMETFIIRSLWLTSFGIIFAGTIALMCILVPGGLLPTRRKSRRG